METAPAAPTPAAPAVPDEILRLRKTIDNVDAALVHLLAERFKATERVGEIKAMSALPPADPTREEQQIERLTGIAVEAGLDPAFTERFREFVVAEVIRRHELIADEFATGKRQGTMPPLDTFA